MNPEGKKGDVLTTYHRKRARQERKLAETARTPIARNLHEKMAELHESLAPPE